MLLRPARHGPKSASGPGGDSGGGPGYRPGSLGERSARKAEEPEKGAQRLTEPLKGDADICIPLLSHEALTEWAAIKEKVTAFEPKPLDPDTRARLEAIKDYLDVQPLATHLGAVLRVSFCAIGNRDNPPEHHELLNVLWLYSEIASMIGDMEIAGGSIRYRLRMADSAGRAQQ